MIEASQPSSQLFSAMQRLFSSLVVGICIISYSTGCSDEIGGKPAKDGAITGTTESAISVANADALFYQGVRVLRFSLFQMEIPERVSVNPKDYYMRGIDLLRQAHVTGNTKAEPLYNEIQDALGGPSTTSTNIVEKHMRLQAKLDALVREAPPPVSKTRSGVNIDSLDDNEKVRLLIDCTYGEVPDFKTGKQIAERLATADNPYGYFFNAEYATFGWGIPKDEDRATGQYMMAYSHGCPYAAEIVGDRYIQQRGMGFSGLKAIGRAIWMYRIAVRKDASVTAGQKLHNLSQEAFYADIDKMASESSSILEFFMLLDRYAQKHDR